MDTLAEAQSLYRESLDAQREQRRQIEEDLDFSDPSDPRQWDETVKQMRESDPGGKRPCLVHDQIGQYIANVAGQVEKQPPSIHAIPVNGGAEKQAAEQIDGRFRHIEHISGASMHYMRALTSAARSGVGYMIVRPEHVNRRYNWQEPRIGSEGDPLKVVFDPWSTLVDGSDATFGYILNTISPTIFARRWPKKEAQDFGDTEATRKEDERKSVLVAEQWYQETKRRKMVIYTDAKGEEQSAPEDEFLMITDGTLPVHRVVDDRYQCVKWRMMSGADVLEETEYPADYIGIVPVYGYISFGDGRMKYCGMARRARVPQQAYNYHVSEMLAYIGTSPKAPWVIPHRALAGAGVQAIWDKASAESRAYLPYADIDDLGPINAPQRAQAGANLINHEQGAERARRDIESSLGLYQANLGAPSNETSGVAIESRKQQGEAAVAHFQSQMGASIAHVGRIVMQMDARLSDGRREQPIMGLDGTSGRVTYDPRGKKAFQRDEKGVTVNPSVGEYGVRVVVGASYSTQRTQTNAAFAEIMRGNKELAPTVAPFWAQTLDFPGSDKFAQALTAMAPPAVKAILQPEGQDNEKMEPAQMAAKLAEVQQALQEAIQHAQEAQMDADQAQAETAKLKQELAGKHGELEIKEYQAYTERLKVTGAQQQELQRVATDVIQQMINHPDPIPELDGEELMPGEQGELDMTPAEPNPELVAVLDSQKQMGEALTAVIDGQRQLDETMKAVMQTIARPRKRVPVRDKTGDIVHVIDSMEE